MADLTQKRGRRSGVSSLIDRRPMYRILLQKSKGPLATLLGLFFLAMPYLIDGPADLPLEGWRVFGVFLACTTFWVTQVIPLGATGLLALAMLPMASGLSSGTVFSYFGNRAVFFLISAFLLAAGVRSTGLSVRVALWVFGRFGKSPQQLVIAIVLIGYTMSLVMPEHAVAAMMFPILAEVIDALGRPQEDTKLYASRLYLAMVWGVVCGGVVTFLGGARAPLAIGILEQSTGITIGFAEWLKYSIPVSVPMLVLVLLMVRFGFRWWPDTIEHARHVLARKHRMLGPPKRTEKMAAWILGGTLVCWVSFGESYDLAIIGLIGALMLVLTRTVTYRELQGGVDWSVIFLYGGAIALGKIMIDTQAAMWLADRIVPTDLDWRLQLVVIGALALVATEMISNAAVVALLLPVALGKLQHTGIDPKLIAVSVALMSGFVFNLPIGTPAMSLAFGSGFLDVKTTMKRGVILSSASIALFAISLYYLWS